MSWHETDAVVCRGEAALAAHVFVVDDTAHTLQLMTYLLQAHGHQVRGFANAEPAIAAAAEDRPELILMDIQLNGGIDGYQALTRLRGDPRLAGIPTIAVTAFAMVGDREHAMSSGFAGYLSKPVDPYTFAEQVDQHLAPDLRGRPPTPRSGVTGPAQSTPTVGDDAAGPSVLVVDDLPSNIELIRSILRPHGYTVTGAVSVAGGLMAARTTRPALILSDLHIGGDSGLELRRRVRADPDLTGIPFAFTTATAARLDSIDDNVPVIHRPLDPVAFADIVTRLTHAHP
jgi:two-component system cell cycle response regulator